MAGRTRRTASTAMAGRVATRDRHCRFPGCHRPAVTGSRRQVQVDHVRSWASLGETADENAMLLCEAQNHAKQLTHWTARLDPATAEVVWTNRLLGIEIRQPCPSWD